MDPAPRTPTVPLLRGGELATFDADDERAQFANWAHFLLRYQQNSSYSNCHPLPIVISGMACRLPGGIDSADLLWQSASGCGTSVPCFYARAYDPISGLATRRYGGHRHGLLFKTESRSTCSNDRLRQVWRWVKG
jgi:hypothetical protein